MSSRRAFSTSAWPSATSVVERPRCQKRIVSCGDSRPGRRPATTSPSSACSVSARQQALVDVAPQRAERARAGLAPVVHDDLVHAVEQVELDRAHRPVRHHQRAGLDPGRPQQRLRRPQAARLDHDVGAAHARLPVVDGDDLGVELRVAAGRRTRRGSRRGASARAPRQVEHARQQPHVPVGGAAAADVAEHARVAAGQVAGAERGHGAGAHLGDAGGVDDRDRHAGLGVEQVEDGELGRQAAPPVVDEVADDLHARQAQRAHDAPQDVEVPVDAAARHEVDARLEHRPALALRAEGGLDRVQDLVVGEREPLDVRAVQVEKLDRLHGGVPPRGSSSRRAGRRACPCSAGRRAPAAPRRGGRRRCAGWPPSRAP